MTLLLALTLFGIPGLFEGADPGSCPGSAERSAALVRQIRRDWPLRSSTDPLSRYVNMLAWRLIHATNGEISGKPVHFDIARNLDPNAFTAGDGYVIVTDGLVAYVANESQLAAVLAHEMGHVLEGHFCQQKQPQDDEYRIGSLVQRYDAAAEEQADAHAVALLRDAGFDPTAMATLLSCLAHDNPGFKAQLHRRIERLEQVTAALPMPRQAYRNSPDFLAVRRAVLDDLKDIAPELKDRALGQTCSGGAQDSPTPHPPHPQVKPVPQKRSEPKARPSPKAPPAPQTKPAPNPSSPSPSRQPIW